jgi:WD40 repeat protein
MWFAECEMLVYEDHKAVVYALAFAPDGSALASGAKDGSVFCRDAAGQRYPLVECGPTTPSVHSLVYSPDGSSIFIGGGFGWLGLRNEGGIWKVFGPPNQASVTALAMLDDRTIAVGTGDRVKNTCGAFELWDVVSGQKREPHFLEPNGVRAVAVCPAKRIVAWATGYRKVLVWEILKQKPLEFPLPKPCPAVALSPDGKHVAAAVDYSVKVYAIDKRRDRERVELKGHKGPVSAVVFSPDGETIATGSWDQTVKLWDAATGRERASFRWPIGRVYCLTYAPDGLRLAAGGDQFSIVVWDME